jgi:RNA polymerase sigma-70 factor, ECF subfamily
MAFYQGGFPQLMASSCDLRAVGAVLRPYVVRRVGAADADDVLQVILHRVYGSVRDIEDETRYLAWLHSIGHNAIIDHHRQQKRTEAKHHAFAEETFTSDPEPGEAEQALAQFMGYFVEQLPSPYRDAVRLTELEGLTMREAAEREGVSVSGMKSRVQRGRRILRELLEGCCEIALDARGRVIEVVPRAR